MSSSYLFLILIYLNNIFLLGNIIDIFAEIVHQAGIDILEETYQNSYIPSWKRINSAIPNFLQHLYEAVESDNKE
ncbi:MAG: hypothetical protein U9R32_00260 [Bacteroidota bacterium]|nr:hypothetical protein [Bacteroidota bacterium]